MVLTERETYFEEMQCLAAGADDYQSLEKPFSLLWRRVLCISFRREGVRGGCWGKAGLLEHREERMFTLDGKPLILTGKEYGVLHILMQYRGQLVTREEFLERVWGSGYQGDARTIDTIVKQLRHKLNESGITIRTHYGMGYSVCL